MMPFRWASQAPTKVATVSLLSAPREGEASSWSTYDAAPLGLPGTRERCGSFAVRNPQGRRGFILVSVRHHSDGPPGAHERGDSSQFAASQGRRGFIVVDVWQQSAEPPRSPRKWRQFRSSRPPGTARPPSGLRLTPPHLASQEPPKLATASQFAAPRDGKASFWSAYDTTPLGLPGIRERCGCFAVHNPQGR